ncbi:MAG: MFS transporter [Dehalococcoidia bacterium]|nr:MFS transporter [Dehalococcoidia bacterium]
MKYLPRISAIPLPVRLAAISFLFSLSVYASSIFLPLYADELNASKFQVGLIASAYGAAYFGSSLVFGRLSDKYGRLIFARLGLGLAVAAYLLQIPVSSPAALLAVRAFVGFCLGISSASIMAYVYESEGQIGRFSSYGSLGWLLGCVAAAVVRDYYALFAISGAASGLALCVSFTFREEKGKSIQTPVFPLSLIRSNLKVYLPFFLRSLGSNAIWAVFPLYLVGIGATKTWVAVLDGVNMAVQFVGMRYVQRFSSSAIFKMGLLVSSVVFVAYGLAGHYLQLMPVQVLLAVSWSCLWVGALSYLLGKNVERGTAAGLLYSTTYLSYGLGPLIGGALTQKWGFEVLMYFAAGLTFVGILLSRVLPDSPRATSSN